MFFDMIKISKYINVYYYNNYGDCNLQLERMKKYKLGQCL